MMAAMGSPRKLKSLEKAKTPKAKMKRDVVEAEAGGEPPQQQGPRHSRPGLVPMLNLAATPGMICSPLRPHGGLSGSQTERPAHRPTAHVADNVQQINRVWGDQGPFIHNLQCQRFRALRYEALSLVEEQRAALSRQDVEALEHPPDIKDYITIDVARPDPFSRPGSENMPRVPTGYFGSQTERLSRVKPAKGISTILCNTQARRRFLRETAKTLTKEGALAPYQIEPLPKYVPRQADLLAPDKIDDEVIVVRQESKRIQKALHMLNCHIRNGTVKTTAQHEERREEILSTQRDIQRLKDTASLIVDSLGQDKEQVQARYDFVRANKNMLSLSDPRFKTARAIRQSVLKMESMEKAVLRTGAVEMERCSHLGSMMLDRNKKVQQRLKETDPHFIRRCHVEMRWLTAAVAAHAVRGFLIPLWRYKDLREAMARVIQKVWKGFWQRKKMSQLNVMLALRGKMPEVVARARERIQDRSADIVVSFLRMIGDSLSVIRTVRKFMERTVMMQRFIRDFLQRTRASKAKLIANFDRLEKVVQHILIREKVKQQSIQKAEREGGGKNKAGKEASKKKGNIIEPDHIDYNKLNNELHRVAVYDEVKVAMCHALLSSKRVKFVVRKKNWRLDMKSYRSSLHQSLLFRKEVAEILEGTELEHLSNNLDVLAKNNVGLKEMMRTMNRSLPIKPEFRDGVSDEKMKDLIRQCQYICSRSNFSLRLLLANQTLPVSVVQPPEWLINQYIGDDKEMLASIKSVSPGRNKPSAEKKAAFE